MYYDGFFCFKQKTAYEVRISDWSSDVCSSDLDHLLRDLVAVDVDLDAVDVVAVVAERAQRGWLATRGRLHVERQLGAGAQPAQRVRSEEHTSELPSLMRISYAVFCLQKKKTK